MRCPSRFRPDDSRLWWQCAKREGHWFSHGSTLPTNSRLWEQKRPWKVVWPKDALEGTDE